MHTTRRRLTLIGLSSMLLVAACGGGSAPTTAPGATVQPAAATQPAGTTASETTPVGAGPTQAPGGVAAASDPCSLLTANQIKDATGFSPLKPGVSGPSMGIFEFGCEWELDNPGGTPWSVILGIRSPGGLDYFTRYFKSLDEGEKVDGIGDDALQQDVGAVLAVKGDTLIAVDYIVFPGQHTTIVKLARAAASNL